MVGEHAEEKKKSPIVALVICPTQQVSCQRYISAVGGDSIWDFGWSIFPPPTYVAVAFLASGPKGIQRKFAPYGDASSSSRLYGLLTPGVGSDIRPKDG